MIGDGAAGNLSHDHITKKSFSFAFENNSLLVLISVATLFVDVCLSRFPTNNKPKNAIMMRTALEMKRNILVSCHYVYRNLPRASNNGAGVRVLDGTWFMPNSPQNAFESFTKEHVPTASFFDIDKVSSHSEAQLPHMLPSEQHFEQCVTDMGVSNDDHVVVYDQHGIFSACRVWYTFKLFGHDQVSIMDGGLPKWKRRGYPTEGTQASPGSLSPNSSNNNNQLDHDFSIVGSQQQSDASQKPSKYTANFHAELVKDLNQMQQIISDKSYTIIDARPAGRFSGKDPEPRQSLISGHMPNSLNIPYNKLLNEKGIFKSEAELRQIFTEAGLKVDDTGAVERPIVSTCGSGITACVLLYALNLIGVKFDRLNLYDGSWAEYGNPANNTRIERDE